MILTSENILKRIEEDGLIEDYRSINTQLQPGSFDLRVGKVFKSYSELNKNDPYPVVLGEEVEYGSEIEYEMGTGYPVKPKEFVLATTLETINMPDDLSAVIQGRSSIGRTGLFVENAGFVDVGFTGEITLEFYNATENTIVVPVGMRVCQIVFYEMQESCSEVYEGKYNGQTGATGSKIHEDSEFQEELAKY